MQALVWYLYAAFPTFAISALIDSIGVHSAPAARVFPVVFLTRLPPDQLGPGLCITRDAIYVGGSGFNIGAQFMFHLFEP